MKPHERKAILHIPEDDAGTDFYPHGAAVSYVGCRDPSIFHQASLPNAITNLSLTLIMA